MANLGGIHKQPRSGRQITYWAAFAPTGPVSVFYVAVFSQDGAYLAQHEEEIRFDPTGVPAESLVRMSLLRHIDRTVFGEGKPPSRDWIGQPWRMALL